MQLGFIGLGNMGQNMVTHLLEQGIGVVGYNRTKEVTDQFKSQNAKLTPAYSIGELVKQLPSPRVIWIMVSAGSPVDDVINELLTSSLTAGDIVIDGGNSFYKDSIKRGEMLSTKSVQFIDCGTSGGLSGGTNGACLMLGGDEIVVKQLTWLWDALAIKDGWEYFGASGAGHFVKMCHNAVEYGMNQALGEGFELMSKSPYKPDLSAVAKTWNRGSIVRGYLVDLLAQALTSDPNLEHLTGHVGGGETGSWALTTAKELGITTEVLAASVKARETSQTNPTFATKVVSALRRGYGGHEEKT